MSILYYLFAIPLIAVLFAACVTWEIKKHSPGSDKMKEVAQAIHQGARVFLIKEFKVMAGLFILIALFLGLINNSIWPPFLFLFGAFCSALAGFLGMTIATRTNVRTAKAAETSFGQSFNLAFAGGKVMGFLVVGIGLLGVLIVWQLSGEVSFLINFALGASLVALFMRVSGGVYTKSADVGADLVGKIEAGIPEDDPRNPAVVADLVGDNVGDTAGMGSDLFESYVSSIIASMVLGFHFLGTKGLLIPLLLAAAGILSSLIGNFLTRIPIKPKQQSFSQQTKIARGAMQKATIFANLLLIVSSFFIIKNYFNELSYFYVVLFGLMAGYLIGEVTNHYTSEERKPVRGIARASKEGPSGVILEGIVVGMKSAFLPALIIGGATVLAFHFGGFYGIALASVGILGTLAMNLSTDCYGPIADNAAGIAEAAGLEPEARRRAEALDAVGNTTAATGKGFAISAAALAALAWLATYFQEIKVDSVNFLNPALIGGLFIGSALTFFFSALLIKSVNRGAGQIVKEVRRQFREIEGLLAGTAKADYNSCISIATNAALKSMVLPGLLLVFTPLIVGLTLGLEAVGGVLAGALVTALPLALFMANSGGAWDNAKKYIEAGNLGGKGSSAHQAAVVGDTIGDPFKDTAGPSLNILVKLLGVVALTLIPLLM